ncbi:MAG TPA: hypothetical protein VGB45_04375 [Abditibacterium sp.]|jgi:Spy/CpxP family protein refolding chaperone
MKIIFTRRLAPPALAATFAVAAPTTLPLAFAQPAQAPRDDLRARTQKQVQKLLQRGGSGMRSLNLSPSQKAKLKAIAQKNMPVARSVWYDDSLSMAQKRAKTRAFQREMTAVLTPAQKQKLVSARRAAMGQLFETAIWVSNELNLNSSQQEKLKSIVSQSMKTARGGKAGAIQDLVLDSYGQVIKVLTPSQKEKWDVMRSVARQEIGKNARVWFTNFEAI